MEGEKLKVLMTTDTVGGVWFYALELCRALQKYDVQIHLASMGSWPSPAQQVAVEEMPNVLLYKSDYKLEWMQDPWDDVEQSRKWINSIYYTVQPDIVHLNNYAHVEADWTSPVISVFHSCVQTWWQAVKGISAPDEWNQYNQIVKDSLQASDVVVAPTKAILEQAQAAHGFTTEARTIFNGRSIDAGDHEKEKIILCMGRMWDEAKNLPLLAKIAKKLPWPVFVAGDTENPDTGQSCSIENVNFLGKLDQQEVQQWMRRAAVFISPTRYEPFGLAILEAAGNGCALVLSNLSTLRELWEGSAAFFDPENEIGAERIISELLNNPNSLGDLQERAVERSKNYTAEKMGASYFKLYEQVAQTQHKAIS